MKSDCGMTEQEKRARRKLYYARENEKRRKLAEERRKIKRLRPTAPMPTAEQFLIAWSSRDETQLSMIRFGEMLNCIECHLDNSLKIDACGDIAGREGGIRKWLHRDVPQLVPHYKTLMRYKAMAKKLRQVVGVPAAAATEELFRHPNFTVLMQEIEKQNQGHFLSQTFDAINNVLDRHLKPVDPDSAKCSQIENCLRNPSVPFRT